jgi:hypothetical protein
VPRVILSTELTLIVRSIKRQRKFFTAPLGLKLLGICRNLAIRTVLSPSSNRHPPSISIDRPPNRLVPCRSVNEIVLMSFLPHTPNGLRISRAPSAGEGLPILTSSIVRRTVAGDRPGVKTGRVPGDSAA